MARILNVVTLFVFLLLLKAAFADTRIVRIDINEVEENDRIHALETYYGKTIAVSKIQSRGDISATPVYLKLASDILIDDVVKLKNGKKISLEELEYAYIAKDFVAVKKEDTQGKHPASDGTAGTAGGK